MSKLLETLKVNDRETFSKFLELLHQDLNENPDSWENKNLSDFLEAMSRYASDIDGFYKNTNQNINADEPSWTVFADIFRGAKIYE